MKPKPFIISFNDLMPPVLPGHYLNHFQSPNSMPYFMPIERRNYLMILKSAKAHGEKNDEPPTVVNLKSGW